MEAQNRVVGAAGGGEGHSSHTNRHSFRMTGNWSRSSGASTLIAFRSSDLLQAPISDPESSQDSRASFSQDFWTRIQKSEAALF